MKVIKASKKRSQGNDIFHIDILYPGLALGLSDTGYYTIGRIDHASFRPPGRVPMHPHRNDEILSYMRSGLQIHKDSTGHQEQVSASKLMLMNAGSGIFHEEIAEKEVEMLQIFMRPSENGLAPKVQFHQFPDVYSENEWRLVAGNAPHAPLELRTDTNIFDARLPKDKVLQLPAVSERNVYLLYCFNGTVSVAGNILEKGDSIVFNNEDISVNAITESDLVLFQIKEDAKYSDTGMYSGNQFK
ncbi:MAG: pirin family protein [Niastella sp.]|nr:pirin family protein [Niastella sp.]